MIATCKKGIAKLKKDNTPLDLYLWLIKNQKSEIYPFVFKHFFVLNRMSSIKQKGIDELILKKSKVSSFADLLMHIDNEKYQFSFASKILHMQNPELPIYDSHIADIIGWNFQNKKSKLKHCNTRKEKISELNKLWEEFQKTWTEFTKKDYSHCCELFNKALPKYKNISRTKKLDFVMWASKKN
jgi:hypothetical protein